jgi:hypothetical protein
MLFRLSAMRTRRRLAGLMLTAFAVRALIAPGFMPAHAAPLTLEICPDGFPAQLLGHVAHHAHGKHAHADHCVFGGAGGTAPAPQLANLDGVWLAPQPPAELSERPPPVVQLIHLPQARGPPATASSGVASRT